MKELIATIALVAGEASAGETPPPDRGRIEAAAARCGLPAGFLRAGRDAQGDFADVSPDGDPGRLNPQALVCLIRWAQRTGARVGFISEPGPGAQTVVREPAESIERAAEAARECGLPVRIDPLSPEESLLRAPRDAPPIRSDGPEGAVPPSSEGRSLFGQAGGLERRFHRRD